MREVIRTDGAPAPIGPYSQAVRAGDFLFLSGQIALDPESGEMVGGGDVRAEADRCLKSLSAVLEAAGGSLASVVKATVFLASIDDFAAMNEVYAEYFGSACPARAAVGVAALPKGVAIEIEAIAVRA